MEHKREDCPHCGFELSAWVEEDFNVEPSGFDLTYSICVNDNCPYYVGGFEVIGRNFNLAQGVLSHRYAEDKDGNELSILSSKYSQYSYNRLQEPGPVMEAPTCCEGKMAPDQDNYDKLNPHYYTRGKIECIDYIIDKDLNFLEGNVVKYLTRWRYNNGVVDLEKALWYLHKLIECHKKGTKQNTACTCGGGKCKQ